MGVFILSVAIAPEYLRQFTFHHYALSACFGMFNKLNQATAYGCP